MLQTILLFLLPLLPIICGILIYALPCLRHEKKRNAFLLISLTLNVALTVFLCFQGNRHFTVFFITPSLPLILLSDELSRFFAILVACVWLLAGIFSLGYMRNQENLSRYYAFYLLTEGALMGLCFAGTLITMYLFFEMMTLMSVALVVHGMETKAIAAGIKYLLYSIAGALMGLLGIFFFTAHSTSSLFVAGGMLSSTSIQQHSNLLLFILLITIIGFGTKAGMFPMHGWLPTAHPIAPAPASAVLSGVIVKAGVLCILRVLYYAVGASFWQNTFVQPILLTLALVTIFMGSMLALKEQDIKKRLAYSTVSQVSYILFGIFTGNRIAMLGALAHLCFHSLMKSSLFMSAGFIIHETGKTHVADLRGIGQRMPYTLWCFTLCGLSLMGIPPLSGFISKWWLATGSIQGGLDPYSWLGPVILLVSALLTAGYTLPISIAAFFPERNPEFAAFTSHANMQKSVRPPFTLFIPILILTIATVILGLWPALVKNAATAISNAIL